MTITATFTGKNSLGYEHGKTYTLELVEHDILERIFGGTKLHIVRVDGTGKCPYTNIKTFLKNWTNIETP